MPVLSPQDTLNELITTRPCRARVLERFGIDYLADSNRTLADVCGEMEIELFYILEHLSYCDLEDEGSERNWNNASISDLIDYIVKAHHAWLKDILPWLSEKLLRIEAYSNDIYPNIKEVRQIFDEYRKEMEDHLAMEEVMLFPACRKLEKSTSSPRLHFDTVSTPVRVLVEEHHEAGASLYKIKELMNDFLVPDNADNILSAVLGAFRELEIKMEEHMRLENDILFQKAIKAEEALK